MGIYIKGMEKPKSCEVCPLGVEVDTVYETAIGCRVNFMLRSKGNYNNRPEWCPLVPVTPHGRLIDESWLKKAMITTLEALKANPKMDGQEMHLIAAFDTLRVMLEDCPTVIEAEEDE